MKVHIIVDYMFLYYKYKAMLDYNRLKRLTANIKVNGNTSGEEVQAVDISNIFYTLKEIEMFRRQAEKNGNDVTLSVCFDAPSPVRKEDDKNYKSNRASNRLGNTDFDNIAIVRELLSKAGHNVYYREGAEADDLIYNLVKKYEDKFDATAIYTPDADIFININNKVGVYRYKGKKGYTAVGKNNFNEYCLQEFNCDIRYNSIVLYKCTCGDKSDNIIGIRGFGPAKFNSLVEYLDGTGFTDWESLREPKNVENLVRNCDFFTDNQREECLNSLMLVSPKNISDIAEPKNRSTKDKRIESYGELGMKSLFS